MGVIKGVLREELGNSIQLKKSYEKALAELPKGSLVRKKIKGHHYHYIVLRNKGKVQFIYKGKVSEEEVKRYKARGYEVEELPSYQGNINGSEVKDPIAGTEVRSQRKFISKPFQDNLLFEDNSTTT